MHVIDRDVQRHKERLKGALRAKLPEVVASEDIVLAPSGRVLRVPVRMLDEPRFRPAPPPARAVAGGRGDGAGTTHQEPTMEVSLSLDELADMLFSELRLPELVPRSGVADEERRVEGVTRQGPMGRLDRRRTLLEHLKGDGIWRQEQLRFRDLAVRSEDVLRAVVVFVRDASGSMDDARRFRVRAAAFWTLRWLRRRYPDVACAFVVHDTAAEEVDEHEFFHIAHMGGTLISSGLAFAEELLERRHPSGQWNRYVLFFSDGKDLPGDEPAVARLVGRLAATCQLVGYGEVEDHPGEHGLLAHLRAACAGVPRLRAAGIRRDDEVAGWLRLVFGDAGHVA